jgi:hypothetical protein
MDETPLMMTPSSGKTWAQKGSSNVFSFGAKDKRQITGTTPWINYNSDIVLFHTTLNRIPVIAPILGQRKWGPFFAVVYLPQKLVLSPPIERQYKPFQKHVSSY